MLPYSRIIYSMGGRTGVAITEYLTYGGLSGSAELMNTALDIAWDYVENEIDTNIVNALESQEIHLWPRELRDWNERYDRIILDKTHVNSVDSVQLLSDVYAGCSCQLTVFSGCAILVDAEAGYIAVRECANCAAASCMSCGTTRPYQAKVNYYAGLFPNAILDKNIILAVVFKAREIMQSMSGSLQDIGSYSVTSWRSMDYSETKAGPKSGSSFINDYIGQLLRPYIIKRAFSLRRTY